MENVTIHTILDGVKFSRVWVKLVTEHTVFCRKFYSLSEFIISLVKVQGNVGNITFKVFFCELMVYYKCILIILSIFFVVFCGLRYFVANLILPKITHFLG